MKPTDLLAAPTAVLRGAQRRFAPEDLFGRTAAVTGAGHGIGRGIALALAEAGVQLALSDINPERLAETRSLLPSSTQVRTDVVDVADRAAVEAWAANVAAAFGGVDVAVNNAGIAHFGTVAGTSDEDLQRVLNTNYFGVVHGTKAFLPHLLASESPHLVNVASIFGVVALPTQSAYAASKFAVRGFSESLAAEMRQLRTGVQVHVVLPGGVATAIAADASAGDTEGLLDVDRTRAGFQSIARTSPEQAGRTIVSGVRRGQERIIVGADAAVMDVLARLLPSGHRALLARALR